MIPEAELLDDNMQTYEEFRAQVDRENGMDPDIDIKVKKITQEVPVALSKTLTPKPIQIFP